MHRSSRLALALVLSSALLSACRDTSSAPSGGTAASSAEVRWRDGGGAELAIGERIVPLPGGELAEAAHPAIVQDEHAKRFAYARASGEIRVVYVVAANAYLGPLTKAPTDFRAAPDTEHALGALFENAGERRSSLVADVMKEKGDAGVAHLLEQGAYVDAKEWDDAFSKLPEPRAAEVKTSLAGLLDKGKPPAGLRRAVALVPLREPARLPGLVARVRELIEPIREPRASAVMLRAVAALDKGQGAQLGCDVLAKTPLDTANAKGSPEEIDRPGREALVEAAVLAVAAGGTECAQVAAQLGEDACIPSFRCGESGPLSGRETSKQDEPLCTKEQLSKAIAQELDRAPPDVLAIASGTRPQLFAFASLSTAGKLPPSFATAHTRRRYAVVQPKDPPCDNVPPGTACHCEEAILRDQACRHQEGTTVQVGLCKFEIDDKQKKLSNVVATLPP